MTPTPTTDALFFRGEKLQSKAFRLVERPKEPLLLECESPDGEPGRDECRLFDENNLKLYREFIESVKRWAKENPDVAEQWDLKNGKQKEKEELMLKKLEALYDSSHLHKD
ncbi:unnamed protein product [Orchesella dallaii]|uniref:Uncharacterized protein n=1 Tax=Orchesella dallaii TaxID=48710 RepID=A0ABP1Q3Y1_9HEXA